jgi:hypothetical protein
MPFQTDNAWPAGLLTIFEHGRAKHSTFENCYYGPYDKLLNYCFGSDFTFYVAPQNPPASDSHDTVDFIVFLVVFNSDDEPVLIVEVKDDSWAQKAELRYRADKQMCDRYGLMLDDCPTPKVSATYSTAMLWHFWKPATGCFNHGDARLLAVYVR